MTVDANNPKRRPTLDADSVNGPESEAPPVARPGKTKRRDPAGSAAGPKPRTAKQAAADLAKAERRLAAEIIQKETDDRFTPHEMVSAFEDSFGEIDFDPCWHAGSAVVPKRYLNVREGHNGLRDDWSGPFALVNPPWSAQDKWLRRAHHEWKAGRVTTVVCIVPAKTDARFFHDTLAKDADVYFLEGRPRFFKEDKTSEGTMVAVMVVMLGATDEQKKRFAKLVRGSWCRLARLTSDLSAQERVGSIRTIRSYGQSSCAPLYRRGDVCPTVRCTPLIRGAASGQPSASP